MACRGLTAIAWLAQFERIWMLAATDHLLEYQLPVKALAQAAIQQIISAQKRNPKTTGRRSNRSFGLTVQPSTKTIHEN